MAHSLLQPGHLKKLTSYNFETKQDMKQIWIRVYRICLKIKRKKFYSVLTLIYTRKNLQTKNQKYGNPISHRLLQPLTISKQLND